MKHCPKCDLQINGNFTQCPLCKNLLTSTAKNKSGDIFPYVPIETRKLDVVIKLLLACSIFVVILSVLINLVITHEGAWCLTVLAGVVCMWAVMLVAYYARNNIVKGLIELITVCSIMSVAWDLFTGWHRWSINFVMPISFISVMTAVAIIHKVPRFYTKTHIFYTILLVFYCLIPIIFISTNLTTVMLPSLICIIGSTAWLSLLLAFDGKNMLHELQRRFHV